MKNLKMFAIAVMAFAVMAMGVHADDNLEMTIGNLTKHPTDLKTALTNAGDEENITIKVLKTYSDGSSNAVTITDKNVTLDLNGYSVTLTNPIIVKGGTLTVKASENGTAIEENPNTIFGNGRFAAINVMGPGSHLTINKDVIVDANSNDNDNGAYAVALFTDDGTTQKTVTNTTIDIYGTLKSTKTNAFGVNGQVLKSEKNAAVINVHDGATISSKENIAYYQGGYAVTTFGAATVEGATGVGAKAGSIALNGTTVTANGNPASNQGDCGSGMYGIGAAIQVESSNGYGSPATIVLNGGTYTSDKTNAMVIRNYSTSATAVTKGSVIKGGASLVSGEDTENGGNLAGIAIVAVNETAANKLLSNLEGFVQNAKFNGDVTEGISVGSDVILASTVQASLTKGSDLNADENGNVTVGTVDENKTPEDQGNTGDGTQTTTPEDTNPNVPDVPKTNDNILVYAGLGLVSALTVSFSAKRKENN